jgi:hypothetical protein
MGKQKKSSDRVPLTRGAIALAEWCARKKISPYQFAMDNELDRLSVKRLLDGRRGRRVSVDLATGIERGTGGDVRAEWFRSDTVDGYVPSRRRAA